MPATPLSCACDNAIPVSRHGRGKAGFITIKSPQTPIWAFRAANGALADAEMLDASNPLYNECGKEWQMYRA
ncbi:MAG: hypothetical protein Q8O63_14075, partial [Hoeflea sp.]|nr:hypothetical protein [Hoeflea sp.]